MNDGQTNDIGQTGPETDLSVANQPAGTTRIEDGTAFGADGKPLGQANEAPMAPGQPAPKVDYKAMAAQMGGTPVPPKVDYHALAAQMGGTPVAPETKQKNAPEQSHDLLTNTFSRIGQLAGVPRDNVSLAQAKNVSDYIYNNILGKDTYQHNNISYDEKPSNAWQLAKQRLWGWLGQDEINKIPGLEPERVDMLRQQGQDFLGREAGALSKLTGVGADVPDIGKKTSDYLREHILNGSVAANVPPEEFARAAAKTVTDFFSPGYYALGAFGKVAQGYQKAAQVAAAAQDWTKAASAMGKARLLGLIGSFGVNVPFAASQAHDLVENWDKMNVPERVAAVSGILGATINAHVGIDAAGGYKKVGGEALDVAKQATSVPAQATKKAVGSLVTLGRAQDFNTAVERASDITKKGFTDHRAKIQNVSPDLQAILNANPTANSPQKFAKAIDDHIQSGEQALLAASGATQHDTAPVVSNLETRLDNHLDKFFSDNRGKYGTQDEVDAAKEDVKNRIMQQAGKDEDGEPILRAPNLFESENIRQGLNIDAAPTYRTDAKPTTNAYKAGAHEATKVLREAIDQAYGDRGIDNVKERRQKEANLIDVRDRLAMAQQKAEAMGNGGLWDGLWKKFGSASTITAIALGTHNPLALGALAPYLASDRIYQNVKNPNRNVAQAAKLAAPNASATELSFRPPTTGGQPPAAPGAPPTGGPVAPSPAPVAPPAAPVLPSHPSQANPHPQAAPEPPPAPHVLAEHAANVGPATMEEPPTNHVLNAELATHFGEPLNHVTLDDRVEHVKNDVEAMRKVGVELTPKQTKVLGAINEHEAAHTDAIEQTQKKSREDAYKVAEELHKMLAQEAAEEKQQQASKKATEMSQERKVNPETEPLHWQEENERLKAIISNDNATDDEKELAKKRLEENQTLQNATRTKQAEAKPLEYTDEEIPVPERYSFVTPRNTRIHELGHLIGSHAMGLSPIDVISHLHPDADPHALAEARSDLAPYMDENGELNGDKIDAKLPQFALRAVAGGIAEEIYGGVPFDGNKTVASDLLGIRALLRRRMSKPFAEHLIEDAKDGARKLLTKDGMSDIFDKYASKRIADTHQNYHLNPAMTVQLSEELGGVKNGKEIVNNGAKAVLSRGDGGARQADTGTEGSQSEVLGEANTGNGERTRTKQRATGLVEKSTGDHDIDAVIRNGGGIPAGVQDFGEFGKIHMFHDPETGSTLGFKPSEKITPQNVGKKLAKSREDFAAGEKANAKRQEAEKATAAKKQTDIQGELAKTREQSRADRAHERSVDIEKAFNTRQDEEKKPGIEFADESTGGTTARLLEKHGESKDPLANGFILSDGRRIAMGATDHADAVRQVTPKNERSPNMQEDMVDYLNRENVVRTRYRDSYGGKEVVFSVPKNGVSEEQVSQMRQAVGKMGRYGNAVMETADSNGKSAQKEFVKPSDIDGMLREIGAHPEQKSDVESYTKPMPLKMRADAREQMEAAGITEAAIHHHELAHGIIGKLEGFSQRGIISHRHPLAKRGNGMIAAAAFDQPTAVRTKENHELFLDRAMAGAAINDAYDGVPRDKNPGLYGDMKNAHRALDAAGFPTSEHEKLINDSIARLKEKLTKPGVEAIIREAARTREDNLPVEFHHSENKVNAITEKVRGILNGQQDSNTTGIAGAGDQANTGAIAGREGEAAGSNPSKAEKLKPFSPPKNTYEVEIKDAQGNTRVENIQALNRKAAFKKAFGIGGDVREVHIKNETKPTVGEPFQTKQSDVANAADEFNKEKGRDEIVPGTTHNPELAKRIADAYDKMPHNPNDPAVEKSYDSLKKDIDDQWDYARDKMGIKFEPWKKDGQPYANSKEMTSDVKNNKHLYFFQGGELPEDHPLTEQAGEGLSYNDKLRAVHDLFGHAAHDYQFGPKGEENAWNVHRQMFSPESIPAVTTETRGQHLRVPFKEVG